MKNFKRYNPQTGKYETVIFKKPKGLNGLIKKYVIKSTKPKKSNGK